MAKLPDLEGLAIFAKVAELRSFSGAASELRLSKATISKAVARIEQRLGANLIVRSARRFSLTDAGRQLVGRAAHILSEGEAAEDVTQAQAQTPRGVVRLAAPLSFGVAFVAPLLPDFLATFPEISVDLHLSDAHVDIAGEGFDAAIRITVQPAASLAVQKLCDISRYLVASPAYLEEYGSPEHPLHLAQHRCISYSNITNGVWRFTKGRNSASVRPSGPLRVNNGDAMLPALIAGAGVGILPDFLAHEPFELGTLERLLPDWSIQTGGVYWAAALEEPTPKRVEVLRDYLISKLTRNPAVKQTRPRSARKANR